MTRRSHCENDYTQVCYQQGASRAATQPESYAQFHFQPGAWLVR